MMSHQQICLYKTANRQVAVAVRNLAVRNNALLTTSSRTAKFSLGGHLAVLELIEFKSIISTDKPPPLQGPPGNGGWAFRPRPCLGLGGNSKEKF